MTPSPSLIGLFALIARLKFATFSVAIFIASTILGAFILLFTITVAFFVFI